MNVLHWKIWVTYQRELISVTEAHTVQTQILNINYKKNNKTLTEMNKNICFTSASCFLVFKSLKSFISLPSLIFEYQWQFFIMLLDHSESNQWNLGIFRSSNLWLCLWFNVFLFRLIFIQSFCVKSTRNPRLKIRFCFYFFLVERQT